MLTFEVLLLDRPPRQGGNIAGQVLVLVIAPAAFHQLKPFLYQSKHHKCSSAMVLFPMAAAGPDGRQHLLD